MHTLNKTTESFPLLSNKAMTVKGTNMKCKFRAKKQLQRTGYFRGLT